LISTRRYYQLFTWGRHMADNFAYEVTGNGLFGVIDLNTGVFTSFGSTGLTLAGLGSYGGVIYGAPDHGNTLYTVNTSTGALTAIGVGNIGGGYALLGSTTTGLYALGWDDALYSINPVTGAATELGSTNVAFGTVMGISTGSDTLYVTTNNSLYALSTTNGSATLIGSTTEGETGFGALVTVGDVLYGGAYGASTPDIYALNPQSGAATFVSASPSTPSAPGVAGFWGLAPTLVTSGPVTFNNATATFYQTYNGSWLPSQMIDGISAVQAGSNPPANGWAIYQNNGQSDQTYSETALLTLATPVAAGPHVWTITVYQNYGGGHLLGDFSLGYSTDPTPNLSSTEIPFTVTGASSLNGTTFTSLGGGQLLAGGPLPSTDVYTITLTETSPVPITGLFLNVINDPNNGLSTGGPGRMGLGNFVVTELTADVSATLALVVTTISATTDNVATILNPGNVVTLSLNFIEPVYVTGSPFLLLNDHEIATYTKGSGTNGLTFTYTVQQGDSTPDLQVTGLNLNGGSIRDDGGVALSGAVQGDLALQVITPVKFGTHYFEFIFDPGISWGAAKSAAASTTYLGATGYLATVNSAAENSFLDNLVTTSFSTFSGAWLGGEVFGGVNGSGGSGYWEVGPLAGQQFSIGQNVTPGAYANWGGAEPNNSQVFSAVYMNVGGEGWGVLNGQWADADHGLANGDGVSTGDNMVGYFVEFALGPTVLSVTALPSSGALNAGKVVTVDLNLTDSVTVTGNPFLLLNDNGIATYTKGSGTNSLTFTYTVQPGENTANLQVTGINLNSGTIQDGEGTALSGSVQGDLGLQIDTTAPTVTINGTGALTNQATHAISGTVDLADAGTTVILLDGVTQVGTAKVQPDGTWATQVSLTGDGLHTLIATDTDGAGNLGTSNPIAYTLDTTPPNLTISQSLAHDTGASGSDWITNDGHVTLSGTVSDANGVAGVEVFDGTTDLGPATITNAAWAFPTVLAEGTHSLYAVAADKAGNPTTSQTEPTIVVDKTAPVPFMSDATKNTNNSLSTLTGVSEANSKVSVYDGAKLIGSVTADGSGNWTLQTNINDSTVHNFAEKSTDLAGNTGSSAGITLYSAGINKSLAGGTGNDYLIAGPKDTLTGGAGNDTFVFNANFGKDVVKDFDVNHDILALSHTLFTGADPIAQILNQTHDSSAGAVIAVDANDSITLNHVTLTQLTQHPSDFHFF
jgi:hypothetical protein